ncbi:hypothetical protein B6V01_001860 [Methanosarcinales archaeon ex4572_44]|nr:MAG: hypothetical protein B6V01_001860 [Methanosarcinales archaeon ex4572_44]
MHERIGRNRIKRVRSIAPLVLLLLMVQLFVPLVTFTQAQTDEHRITFVLGTDENLASVCLCIQLKLQRKHWKCG